MPATFTHRVLIVDDDFTVRGVFSRAFELANIAVDVAEDGVQTMRLLRLHPERYCALILDLNVPAPDGIRIAQHVKKEIPNLPVVVVTADPNAKERIWNAGLERTVKLILPKPFDPNAAVAYVHDECMKPRGTVAPTDRDLRP